MNRLPSPICILRFAFCNLLLASSVAFAADPSPLKVSVQNGAITRELPLVRFDLPSEWRGRTFDVVELRGDRGTCPVQNVSDSQVLWRANAAIAANETVSFELRANEHVASRDVVTAKADDQGIIIASAGKKLLQYNVRTVDPPEVKSSRYRRSGHLHPVWSPSGKVVTEEFPEDHIHQHAIFSAWVNTLFDGRKTDFWNQGGGTGTVVHKAVDGTTSGPVFAEIRTALEHQALEDGRNPRAALVESMTLRGYASPRSHVHVFDVELRQRAASEVPLQVLKYHYGGFAIRGAKEWFPLKDSDYLTSEGRTKKDGNETRPRWVNLHGLVGGEPCGITVIPHPSSFRSPQPVRLHPSKPYFVFSPPVLGDFEITRENEYQASYRLVVHDGEPDATLFDQLASEYAEELLAR
jgi:hypothetical protein